ncbi:hypothetical protein J2045_004440 [Peteryoungia aggregata LMG 23059]|uniref:Uncharacterized protein n=1 Tax=Peteryoungia aggregata LMG 23059 TaxID=1368425 RepID=A0ABU0GDK9_9HYPH|nr:hypothetical protein [Peteryoungia aggregata]MDQ0423388.1 hypothetical protein [Peteryoungia aggregata LMG 23059]
MGLDSRSRFDWASQPPSAFDIVTAYFPETNPKGELRLRPCLILDVLQDEETAEYGCRISFGTKNLKILQRQSIDIIVQNSLHLDEMGLPYATRFDLDAKNIVVLPWSSEFFGCWRGFPSPRIGFLLETYRRDYAYIMAMREINGRA